MAGAGGRGGGATGPWARGLPGVGRRPRRRLSRAAHGSGDGTDRIGRDVYSVLEFNVAVQLVLDWMVGRTGTLLLVTSGLLVLAVRRRP